MADMDCFCSDPPSVSNGEVKYAGPYSNGSRAEYDCDTGYTQSGGSSLLCQAGINCTSPQWVQDASDSNSGTPNCQLPQEIINNNSSENVETLTFSWGYLAPLLVFLILILILLLLLLLCLCCRSYWRHCCLTCCPGCAYCLQEHPTTVVPVRPYPGEEDPRHHETHSKHQVSSPNNQSTESTIQPAGGLMLTNSGSGRHSPGASVSIIRYGSLQEKGLKRYRTDLGLYYSSPVKRQSSLRNKSDQPVRQYNRGHRVQKEEPRKEVVIASIMTEEEVGDNGRKDERPRKNEQEVMVTSIIPEGDSKRVYSDDLSTRSMETQTYDPIKPVINKGGVFTQKPIYYGREKDHYRSFGRRYVPSFGSIAPGGMAHSTHDHRKHKKILGYDPYSMSSTLGKPSSFSKNHHFDSRGQPLWLPHVHQVRRDPNHAKTITK